MGGSYKCTWKLMKQSITLVESNMLVGRRTNPVIPYYHTILLYSRLSPGQWKSLVDHFMCKEYHRSFTFYRIWSWSPTPHHVNKIHGTRDPADKNRVITEGRRPCFISRDWRPQTNHIWNCKAVLLQQHLFKSISPLKQPCLLGCAISIVAALNLSNQVRQS